MECHLRLHLGNSGYGWILRLSSLGLVRMLMISTAAVELRFRLSRMDLRTRMQEAYEMYGDDSCNPGGDPPCGGCGCCILAQVSYYFGIERQEATRYQDAGFEYAPGVIDARELTNGYSRAFAPCHDSWQCKIAGER